jgi:hypothetical protein
LAPLLDSHTRRHHAYLRDTFPHLIPATAGNFASKTPETSGGEKPNHLTADFLTSVLRRVEQSERMSAGRQLAVLAAAGRELERLASIEAAISDPANFARDKRVAANFSDLSGSTQQFSFRSIIMPSQIQNLDRIQIQL